MKARFEKKIPLAWAFADVPKESLLESLTAFQKRTKAIWDKAKPLTMVSAKPWFKSDELDIVKATLAVPNKEAKWGGVIANSHLKWTFIQSRNFHLLEGPCTMITPDLFLYIHEGWRNKNTVHQLDIKCRLETLHRSKLFTFPQKEQPVDLTMEDSPQIVPKHIAFFPTMVKIPTDQNLQEPVSSPAKSNPQENNQQRIESIHLQLCYMNLLSR